MSFICRILSFISVVLLVDSACVGSTPFAEERQVAYTVKDFKFAEESSSIESNGIIQLIPPVIILKECKLQSTIIGEKAMVVGNIPIRKYSKGDILTNSEKERGAFTRLSKINGRKPQDEVSKTVRTGLGNELGLNPKYLDIYRKKP